MSVYRPEEEEEEEDEDSWEQAHQDNRDDAAEIQESDDFKEED